MDTKPNNAYVPEACVLNLNQYDLFIPKSMWFVSWTEFSIVLADVVLTVSSPIQRVTHVIFSCDQAA